MSKILVSLSGGLDSTTLLAYFINRGMRCETISFMYKSKHNQYELKAARDIATHYLVPHNIVDLSYAFEMVESNLLKSGGAIPEGHYEEESMRQTVVPGRNLIFISVMAAIAESRGIEQIGLGTHLGDHFIYPDCRPNFLQYAQMAVQESSDHRVTHINTPFMGLSKADIVALGLGMQVPYHLTRTCYKDQPVPCGKCGSCNERLEAFGMNGTVDPACYTPAWSK